MRTDKDTIYFPSTLREGKNFNANYVSIRNSGEGVILSKTEYKFRHTEQSEVSQTRVLSFNTHPNLLPRENNCFPLQGRGSKGEGSLFPTPLLTIPLAKQFTGLFCSAESLGEE